MRPGHMPGTSTEGAHGKGSTAFRNLSGTKDRWGAERKFSAPFLFMEST